MALTNRHLSVAHKKMQALKVQQSMLWQVVKKMKATGAYKDGSPFGDEIMDVGHDVGTQVDETMLQEQQSSTNPSSSSSTSSQSSSSS